MRNKLKSLPDFKTKDYECDCAWILNNTKGIAQRFEGTRVINMAIAAAIAGFCNFRQGPSVFVPDFYQEFCTKLEIVKHYTKDQPIGTTKAHLEHSGNYKKTARDRDIAILLLRAANQRIYGSLVADLENLYSRVEDQYPTKSFSGLQHALDVPPFCCHADNLCLQRCDDAGSGPRAHFYPNQH
ncbi:hypothetical protein IV203_030739 [Nitzschia inconspicua]|uniref:Uncharacterized protein n=1 Tax=Nitzschia inconspicua TaxID=303405 RepID=A0A9K3LWK7_9STRA|nr:hypothetical protein IV203_030739 [Nitzschia inconspicua]